ncbi:MULTISPECIES: PadR family transcriptional regulator [Bacillaceae]|uniref:PadR family transcriptional regulator n=1 Tax=Bacillaceae TaxID=186817 RepID=UPI001E34AFAC|nr:PadR family transcriptional regulator [Bacillus sp. Au-Bac7]MCE4049252.1 PadR family transcriptional regulator [Bacillus sp. Au-Bac7]
MSLRYALLGIIAKKPVSGYEVVNIFKEQVVYFWNSTHSQIYTELHKLENEELLQHELIIQNSSPNKKIYTITDTGKKELLDWILHSPLKPAKIKDEFLIKAAAFDIMSKAEIIQLLDEVITREERVLSMTKEWQENFSEKSPNTNLGSVITSEYGIRYAEMYLNWCKWVKEYLHNYNSDNN